MKLGITAKLFGVILSACAIVALAVLAAGHYSFGQGFIGYLNKQEEQRLEMLRPVLAQAYEAHGNWSFLRGEPILWFSLIRPPGTPTPMELLAKRAIGEEAVEFPQLPEEYLTGVQLRVTLLDENKNPVVGNPNISASAIMKPIIVDDRTVGWLSLMPFEEVTTGAAEQFEEQRLKTTGLIGAMAIGLAALAALLLAQTFLAPVKRIARSTHALAAGNYGSRVEAASSDELGRLAEDFNQLALTLEKNEQLRRAFMADVSHELRTPLAVLKAELEAVEDGIRPMDMTTVHSLQAEVSKLGKLVDDLYELSLSDVGAMAYRKMRADVVGLLQSTAHAFEERFTAHALTLELDTHAAPRAIVHADPDRMRQLFANLLENSLRYTDAGGKVVVRSRIVQNALHLEFDDTAPGVPEEMLPNLFERFFRGEQSRSRATGGAGLGLAIGRNMVEAHNGTITAQASPLGGVRIAVTLPLDEDQT